MMVAFVNVGVVRGCCWYYNCRYGGTIVDVVIAFVDAVVIVVLLFFFLVLALIVA